MTKRAKYATFSTHEIAGIVAVSVIGALMLRFFSWAFEFVIGTATESLFLFAALFVGAWIARSGIFEDGDEDQVEIIDGAKDYGSGVRRDQAGRMN